jgi:hypothetical protein
MVTYYHNKKNHKNDLKHIKEEIEGGDKSLRITEGGERGEGESSGKKRHLEKKVKEDPDGKRRRSEGKPIFLPFLYSLLYLLLLANITKRTRKRRRDRSKLRQSVEGKSASRKN